MIELKYDVIESKKTTEDDVPVWSPFYQRKQNKT